jgi:late competence protein required for DNA uptake (superfamily II DNA/RNA helicase)
MREDDPLTDEEIRERLERIADFGTSHPSDELTEWEHDFIENIVFKWDGELSEKQQECAERIIKKHY